MSISKEQMIEIFERTGGILSGHFLLTSGRHSDKYMQCAKLFIHADEAEKICKALSESLKKYDAQYVVSPAVGGILFGYELSRHLGCKNVFAERVDGKFSLRRGFDIQKGDRVIVAEDVVTTGGSVREVVELCKELGAEVKAVASLVDRSGGSVSFGDVDFVPLLSVSVISYEANDCPICKTDIPLVKPGSRTGNAAK